MSCELNMMCRGVKLPLRLRAECQVAIVGKSVMSVWMVLCFLAGVAYCAYHRTQLREKFGIAGAPCGPSSVSFDTHSDEGMLGSRSHAVWLFLGRPADLLQEGWPVQGLSHSALG